MKDINGRKIRKWSKWKSQVKVVLTSVFLCCAELASAVEQVILEEYYDIEIEVYVKWKLPSSESQQQILAC